MNINQTFKLMQSAVVALTMVGGGSLVFAGAAAAVDINSSAAVQGTAGSSGLNGTFRQAAPESTKFKIADTKAQLAATAVTATFTSTNIDYLGRDYSSAADFLGPNGDGSTYKGTYGTLSDGIFGFSGFIQVTSPSTVQFSSFHDDSAQLVIGGQTLFSADCCGTNNASATFSTAGFYAVDVIYSNTAVPNRDGGAKFTLNPGLDNHFFQTVTPVPEPETYAMLLAGLGVLGCVARRRKTA